MAKNWCRANLNPGDWVLEPFGFNPLLVIEIASAGYPVLVCVNNPIHAFILQVLASTPKREELIASLQDLAISSKGDDRMEPYIRSLYAVECANCHQRVEADAFLWKKDADQPYAAHVNCPFCQFFGEQPLTEETLKRLTPLPPKRLHLARALNRVADQDDALRKQVEIILNAYPARPLIILQTIFNKLESLKQPPRRKELLIALVLSAADRGNTLWAYPSPRHRPRQVVVPAVYQEKNLWKVMENAIKEWQVLTEPISVKDWEGAPDNHATGIYKYQGRIKNLQPTIEPRFFSAVIAAIPRPNQAFWSLSALWTGWIWGLEAVNPIRQVLSRQRYDWNWHANALMSVFEAVHQFNQPSLKFWGIIAENEPMLLLASLLAADAKGFKLEGFAQSMDDQIAQCTWRSLSNHSIKPEPANPIANEAARSYLQGKAEPASYQQIHAAIITKLAAENNLAAAPFMQNINQAASETQRWVDTFFAESQTLRRLESSHAALESGEWWLIDTSGAKITLADRLEKGIYYHLVNTPVTTFDQVQQAAYQLLPGIFTPENKLIFNCLSSYATLVDQQQGFWKLAKHEQLSERKADKNLIVKSLKQIAHSLGFMVSGEDSLDWFDEAYPQPAYHFDILTSAILSPYIAPSQTPAKNNIIVIPGSRANLLAFKKQRDPILKAKLDQNYFIIKYRLVRDLEINPLLSRELLKEQILTDPPEYHDTQLALF